MGSVTINSSCVDKLFGPNSYFSILKAKFHADTLEPAKKRRKTEQHNVVYDLVRVEGTLCCFHPFHSAFSYSPPLLLSLSLSLFLRFSVF